MSADVALLDLRLRRRSMIGYAVGMGVYGFVIVALYPTFKNDTSLNQFSRSPPRPAGSTPTSTPTSFR